jgi:hypothetical protein
MFGTPVFFGGGPGDAPPGVGVDGAGAFGGANVLRSGPLGTKGEDWDGAVMGKEYTIAVPAHLPFESPSSLNLEKQSAIAAGMAKALGIKAARDIDNGLRDACCCKIRRFWRQIGPTEPLRTVQRDESQWVLMQRANAGNPPPPPPSPPPFVKQAAPIVRRHRRGAMVRFCGGAGGGDGGGVVVRLRPPRERHQVVCRAATSGEEQPLPRRTRCRRCRRPACAATRIATPASAATAPTPRRAGWRTARSIFITHLYKIYDNLLWVII